MIIQKNLKISKWYTYNPFMTTYHSFSRRFMTKNTPGGRKKHRESIKPESHQMSKMFFILLSFSPSSSSSWLVQNCVSGGGRMQKVRGLKYSAPNINVYVLMIFTAFLLKSGGHLPPHAPPISPPLYVTLSQWFSCNTAAFHTE